MSPAPVVEAAATVSSSTAMMGGLLDGGDGAILERHFGCGVRHGFDGIVSSLDVVGPEAVGLDRQRAAIRMVHISEKNLQLTPQAVQEVVGKEH